MASLPFRFDAETHEYVTLDGELLPHITGLLKDSGWIDDRWFREEDSERGRQVHALCARYDLGALDVATCRSPYRAYVQAHAKAMQILGPDWWQVEEPLVHPHWRFGGRPDRVGLVHGARTVLEVKSGAEAKAHPVQTALQAILVSTEHELPAEHWQRMALYLQRTGKFRLIEHKHEGDFSEARKILRTFCRRVA